MSDAASPNERSFEESLAELESIVRELEDGKTNLETAITRYEQGIGLLKSCAGLLREAEQKIIQVTGVDERGEPKIEPFEHTAVERDRPEAKRRKPSESKDPEIPF
jgi:exodeoxyribonuclease VII small subunit